MSTPNDGGLAFPQPLTFNPNGEPVCAGMYIPDACGMTIRDYFAAKAMQGLLANCGGPIQANAMHGWGFANCRIEDVAITAYGLADALLAARNSTAAAAAKE